MSFKSLKEAFNKAVAKIAFWEKPSLPYDRVVNLFDLRNARFTTETRDIWVPGNFHGLPTNYPIYGGDPMRVFRADPNKKIKLYKIGRDGSIHGDQQVIEIPASAAIIATEFEKNATDRLLTVMIFNEIENPERPFDFLVFGLHGERKSDGFIRFKKILIPAADINGTMTGIRAVDLKNETDITTALAFAKACTLQLMAGETLLPGVTINDVKAKALDAKRLPWKKPPAP